MKGQTKDRLHGALIGFVAGVFAFGFAVTFYTGLRIDEVFQIGKDFREHNKDFLADYKLYESNSASALIVLESEGVECLQRDLWRSSKRLYWDTVKHRPQTDLERHFGEHFVQVVRQSKTLSSLADPEKSGD